MPPAELHACSNTRVVQASRQLVLNVCTQFNQLLKSHVTSCTKNQSLYILHCVKLAETAKV